MQGLFVSVEGGEGAGKTTLISSLSSALLDEGRKVLLTREPGGTSLGENIRKILLSPPGKHKIADKAELLLFLSARAQHYEEVIAPALLKGKVVVCDRFHDSTIAYQGIARGIGADKVRDLCAFSTHGRYPDLTIYLDIDPSLGLTRGRRVGNADLAKRKKDRIEAETIAFHQNVRDAFLKLMHDDPKRCRIVDASQSQSDVLKQTLELIHEQFAIIH